MDLQDVIQPVQSYYVMAISNYHQLLFHHKKQIEINLIFLRSIPNINRPTLDEIRSWGKSFDKLMRNPGGRKVFRDFLRCEYSEENILFWLACEELKKETNADAIEEKARFIYEDYISILSPKEVDNSFNNNAFCITARIQINLSSFFK